MSDFSNRRALLEFSFESIAAELPAAALLRLARRTAAYNACMGLTGRLRLDAGRFVQTVEGPPELVLPLAGTILGDRRHGTIRVTALGEIPARRFAEWRDEGFAHGGAIEDGEGGGNVHLLPVRIDRRRTASPALPGAGVAGGPSPLPEA